MTAEPVDIPRKEPQDHLKPAVQREATGEEKVEVVWEGITISIAASVDDWDADTLEAFEEGKAVTGIRSLIGSKVYDQVRKDFAKAHDRNLRVKDAANLMEAVAKACGFESSGE